MPALIDYASYLDRTGDRNGAQSQLEQAAKHLGQGDISNTDYVGYQLAKRYAAQGRWKDAADILTRWWQLTSQSHTEISFEQVRMRI